MWASSLAERTPAPVLSKALQTRVGMGEGGEVEAREGRGRGGGGIAPEGLKELCVVVLRGRLKLLRQRDECVQVRAAARCGAWWWVVVVGVSVRAGEEAEEAEEGEKGRKAWRRGRGRKEREEGEGRERERERENIRERENGKKKTGKGREGDQENDELRRREGGGECLFYRWLPMSLSKRELKRYREVE